MKFLHGLVYSLCVYLLIDVITTVYAVRCVESGYVFVFKYELDNEGLTCLKNNRDVNYVTKVGLRARLKTVKLELQYHLSGAWSVWETRWAWARGSGK